MGSVLVGDLINYIKTNNWEWSPWQQYVGALFGGAIGGIISIWNPVLGIAIGSGLDTLTSGVLEMYIGANKNNITWTNLLFSTATSIGTGLLFGKLTQVIPVKGLTKGSHSIQQVSKSLITKTLNKTITHISLKSFYKIFTYQLTTGFNLGWILQSIFNGFFTNS